MSLPPPTTSAASMAWAPSRAVRLSFALLAASTLFYTQSNHILSSRLVSSLDLHRYLPSPPSLAPPCHVVSEIDATSDDTFLDPGMPLDRVRPAPVAGTDLAPGDQDFCPTDSDGRPTVILVPIDGGVEPFDEDDPMNRSTFLSPSASTNDGAVVSDIGFLPWQPQTAEHAANRIPKWFALHRDVKTPCPVYYVPATSQKPFLPPSARVEDLLHLQHANNKRNHLGVEHCDATTDPVPFTPDEIDLWKERGHPEFLFGFATTPSRALKFLPRWTEWLPSSLGPPISKTLRSRAHSTSRRPHRHQRERRLRRDVAGAVVLSPPGEERDFAWEVVGAARARGVDLNLQAIKASRFEERYFRMIDVLWEEAKTREEETGIEVDWFVFSDDDTYVLSIDSLAHMLSKYDPVKPRIVGTVSESVAAVETFGRIAFGGAGVFVSKGLMKRFHEPGVLDRCIERFSGEFGGDGMLTKCAAMALDRHVSEVVTVEASLHQLDFKGEAHGIFSAGWRFATLHHWASWLMLQPKAHPQVEQDDGLLMGLVAKAARIVGADNWNRRYIFGMGDGASEAQRTNTTKSDAAVVISLGYSVTVVGKGHLSAADLAKTEKTWAGSDRMTRGSTRPALLETKQRRTYYLKEVTAAAPARRYGVETEPEVVIMSHINGEADMLDVVWDARPRPRKRPAPRLEGKASR